MCSIANTEVDKHHDSVSHNLIGVAPAVGTVPNTEMEQKCLLGLSLRTSADLTVLRVLPETLFSRTARRPCHHFSHGQTETFPPGLHISSRDAQCRVFFAGNG